MLRKVCFAIFGLSFISTIIEALTLGQNPSSFVFISITGGILVSVIAILEIMNYLAKRSQGLRHRPT
jgi:hypothetical protein